MTSRIGPILVVLLFNIALQAKEPLGPAVSESAALRRSLLKSESLAVFEGLPHPQWQPQVFAEEAERDDTVTIQKFKFYKPDVKVQEPQSLGELLASSKTIGRWSGPKLCGGFHPDFAVQWTTQQGRKLSALICFGCYEIKFVDGDQVFHYDLREAKTLKAALAAYKKKRPPQPQFF